MYESICPICQLYVHTTELERHANGHFEDEDIARDMELAHQIALAPPSPPLLQNNDIIFETSALKGLESSTLSGDRESEFDVRVCYIIGSQIQENFYRVEAGLIPLLRRCLEFESGQSISILSGYVDHFHSIESRDVGWGCGWRNIQMLSSHLLAHRKEARGVLFGGCGFVPDISSLQRWLEIAWERGFDGIGSRHFDEKIYGKRNWIGTTECATLFRSFGLRARIVDFDGEGIYKRSSALGSLGVKVSGPLDKYLLREDPGISTVGSNLQEKSSFPSLLLGSDTGTSLATGSVKGQQVLIDWVWNYFSDKRVIKLGKDRVIASEKAPLYFQHQGHSRTIVGIQVTHHKKGAKQYNLLVLDPAHKTVHMERALSENIGWQKLIKRGAHTLKESQYQLCYIDSGIAHGEEIEQLKTLDSVYIEL